MPSQRQLPTPNQRSPISDAIQLGAVWPTYTWRKGGTENPEDNHLYLTIGSADELLVPEQDALIEIDPETRFVKFWGATELLEGVSFGENTIYGSSLVNGSITADKLSPGIVIDGSVAKLTTARNINGISFDGTNDVNSFGIVNTAGNNSRKATTITNFKLIAGAQVTIKFTNNNTANDPTLNVSETGDVPIRYNGNNIEANKLTNTKIYTFVYDGVGYNLIGDLDEPVTDENVTVELVSNDDDYKLVLTNNIGTDTSHVQFANSLSFNPNKQLLSVASINSNASSSWSQIHEQSSSIINSTSGASVVGLVTYKTNNGLFTLTGTTNSLIASYTANDDLDTDAPTHLVNLLDVNGDATFPNNINATKFVGTATLAEKAVGDNNGNNIVDTYATKQEVTSTYLPFTGGEITGKLVIPAIGTEQNTVASTVGYVDATVAAATEAVKQEIIGTAGEFGTISDLTNQVTENSNKIADLETLTTNFVRFDQQQTLEDQQKQTARDNIGAYSASGGIITGNVAIDGSLTATNDIVVVNDQLTADQTPVSPISTRLTINDSANTNDVGGVDITVNTDNSTTSALIAKTNSLTGTYQSISVTSNVDGSATTHAPTPKVDSDDNSIATTGWVNDTIETAIIASQKAIAHKLYQGVLAASTYTTIDQGMEYFTEIVPENSLESWQASYVIKVTTPFDDYNAIALVELIGVGQQYSYRYTVAHKSTEVKSFDGINFRPATTSTLASGKGHYVGISMYRSTNPDVIGYERDIDVTVIKQENCTIKLFDNIITGSTISDINITHESNHNTDVRDNGFYYQSNINYGDRLSAWDRLAVAGNDPLIGNTLVAEDQGYHLVSIFKDGQFTTTPFNPYSIQYYTGEDLEANQTGTAQGSLYSVHRFDTENCLGNTTTLTAGSRLLLKGTIDKSTWLFTATEFVTDFDYVDPDACYLLLGYAGSGTIGYLIDNHILYQINGTNYVPLNPVPVVTTPKSTSNDDTIATTSFVQSIAANVSAGSLINPEINTDGDEYTTIFINSPAGQYVRGQTPTNDSKSITQLITFRDGTPLDKNNYENSVIGYVESSVDETSSAISITAISPSSTGDEQYIGFDVGFQKQADGSWKAYTELSESPDSDDNSNAVATTKYVQDNLTGICAYCVCDTAGDVVAKVGTVPKFKLIAGATIIVDFTNGNTAANPTLNVNGTGAHNLVSMGSPLGKLAANSCLMFVYTGSEYKTVGFTFDNPTFYGTVNIDD